MFTKDKKILKKAFYLYLTVNSIIMSSDAYGMMSEELLDNITAEAKCNNLGAKMRQQPKAVVSKPIRLPPVRNEEEEANEKKRRERVVEDCEVKRSSRAPRSS
jgi:hypothetical protein